MEEGSKSVDKPEEVTSGTNYIGQQLEARCLYCKETTTMTVNSQKPNIRGRNSLVLNGTCNKCNKGVTTFRCNDELKKSARLEKKATKNKAK